jgi:DNA-binding Xre family transcriptional regulator
MRRRIGYRWHLRELMATKGMFATTDLGPLLTERGVELSREQVYRLVVGTPERLNLHVLAALCDILTCSPADLIEPVAEPGQVRKMATGAKADKGKAGDPRPTRARLSARPPR